MAHWFYFNKSGEKVGPISVAALKALTQQGLITRETIIENHTGRTAVAGEVNGLEFPERTEAAPTEPTVSPEAVSVDDIEPSSISPEPDATAAMQFGNVPIHTVPAPEQAEVYGLSTPKPTPPVEANPFTVAEPKKEPPVVETNPFTATPPKKEPVAEVNPFAAVSPEKHNPFAGIATTPSRKTPQPEPPGESDSVSDGAKGFPKSILFGGIAVVLVVFLLGGGWWMLTESANKKAVEAFCEKHGSDVKAVDDSGWTLLHKAAFSGNVPVVRFLIGKGADVNAKDQYGSTPLHEAARQYRGEDAAFGGNAPFQLATFDGKVAQDMGDWDYDVPPPAAAAAPVGEPAASYANGKNKIAVIKLLIKSGADVNAKNADGRTPLDIARRESNTATVEYLELCAGNGRDIKKTDEFGNTPLHEAAYKADIAEVKRLVANRANVNAKNDEGETPLHKSINGGHGAEVPKFLVSKGAKVNTADKSGVTPLHLAAAVNEMDVIVFLVSKGANVRAKTNKGTTPEDFARQFGHKAVADYLARQK